MQEERKSLFSVKDVETAIVHFGIMELIIRYLSSGTFSSKAGIRRWRRCFSY